MADYVPAKLWKELFGYLLLSLVGGGISAWSYYGSTGLGDNITYVIALFGLTVGFASGMFAFGTVREIRAYRLRQLTKRYGRHPLDRGYKPRQANYESLLDPRD